MVNEPASQAHHSRMDQVDAGRLDELEPDFYRRQAQIVDRAVLKPGRTRRQIVVVGQDGRKGNRAAGIPGTPQLAGCALTYQQTTCAGWVAKDFVERNGYEVGVPEAKIEPVGWYE